MAKIPLPQLIQTTVDLFTKATGVHLAAAGFPDIRAAHQGVLSAIGSGARLSDLAGAAGVSKQAMAGLVEHLLNRGYVERESDPTDRRAAVLKLTAAGVAARDAVRAAQDHLQGEMRRVVGKKRLRALRETLLECETVLNAVVEAVPAPGKSDPPTAAAAAQLKESRSTTTASGTPPS
jgi:DNA-binding MarR family transcriptional regulator